jgi:two-component system CheB/CheR fusion protein
VQGKSFLNLDIGLPVSELRASIRACFAGEIPEEVMLEAVNRRGKKIKCRVACTPLDTPRKKREGVIMLIDEIS